MPCEIADRTAVEYVTDRQRNPFGLDPKCEPAVPGYGDANARFRAIGARPGVHGGRETGIPFTGRPWSDRLFDALVGGGLVTSFDPETGCLSIVSGSSSRLSRCVHPTRPILPTPPAV